MKEAEKPNVEELEMIMVVIHFQSDSIIAQYQLIFTCSRLKHQSRTFFQILDSLEQVTDTLRSGDHF